MHNNHNSTAQAEFNFESWTQLANENPKLFEQRRRIAIDTVINNAPASIQRRLRGLQWRIDMEIEHSKNPLDSCIKINQMMLAKVYAAGGLLESLNQLTDNRIPPAKNKETVGKIIPFK